jgi:hypothetical protein
MLFRLVQGQAERLLGRMLTILCMPVTTAMLASRAPFSFSSGVAGDHMRGCYGSANNMMMDETDAQVGESWVWARGW